MGLLHCRPAACPAAVQLGAASRRRCPYTAVPASCALQVQPAEHQLRVTLRAAQPGRVDLLEKAVGALLAML